MYHSRTVEYTEISIGCDAGTGRFMHGAGWTEGDAPWGSSTLSEERKAEIRAMIGTECDYCAKNGHPGRIQKDYSRDIKYEQRIPSCVKCDQRTDEPGNTVEMRYSLGITVSEYCDPCWDASGYRKEGKEGYSFDDAGEYYDEDDY